MGRPNKYKTHVEPRFEDIKKWLRLGATEKEIAQNLGIHIDSFIEYKKKYSELTEFIKENRKEPVQEIKAALLKRALGFQYEEKKVIKQKIVIDGANEEKIPATLIKTEITTKTALPDPTSGLILLKHWDSEHEWTSDPQSLKIKKEELELKKKQAENDNW